MKYLFYNLVNSGKNLYVVFFTVLSLVILAGCSGDKKETAETTVTDQAPAVLSPVTLSYELVRTFPHDTTAFTEGLLLHEGQLFESTGSPEEMPQTKSVLGPVDLNTGKIMEKVKLDRTKYFGEGMVILNNKIYQLTYTSKVGFVYDAKTYRKIQEFTFPSKEGWGLTTDGTHLIMSDGTSQLTYLDPATFKTVKILNVKYTYDPLVNLNELEYINGTLFANIYTTNSIVKIDAASGQATGILDLTSLINQVKKTHPNALEMNGIAYNPTGGTFYITGKLWPNIFEIKVKP